MPSRMTTPVETVEGTIPGGGNVERKKRICIEDLYQSLASEFRSTIQTGPNCKCLIRVHNCTPHKITPFWINFRGQPVEYPVIHSASSSSIDTFVSHLWFFKAECQSSNRKFSYKEPVKVLAIPEEAIDLETYASRLEINVENQTSPLNYSGRRRICYLCQLLTQRYALSSNSIPCQHLKREMKFSESDLKSQACSAYRTNNIYSCTEETHRLDHSQERRNIFLVEPFFNLRERCFLALRERVRHPDIVALDLPISLQKEYIQFVTTIQKT